ncbi:CAMK family protein kinase [Trichomonas vaginalis G3]|uniref:CAMK family protein kinase n=1 Tax=Trichomonas vaginalis (strain ATCC PRA-98 / G3) TaxID=412133 RepID=A2DM39_TRIV3|nr:regulation of centriole replication [Trichomonas vaginalis G3]EAY18459.1 CAMK family protein kinase [Trichomonas vaginalis G3]KAI5489552.1 regulation of centriole replication [Trichomonas vaginalis G3]|eukprot:XP_001579445.1 CAMK family protein kinase [Trichomonas vaginalis G3]
MQRDLNIPSHLQRMKSNGEVDVYDFVSELGEGGFASVFHVRRESDHKSFALKVIPHEALQNENFKAKHFAEIEIQSKMDHKNIVKSYDHFKDENNTYILMELCLKGNVKNYLSRKGALSEKEAAKIIKSVCSGVKYCHDHHIIHRDLKLDNFMISDDGDIKIIDFGVSEIVSDSKKKDFVFAGTPMYMGPEVIGLHQYGYQVDIWAIGICTFELLTGHPPFEANNMKDMSKLIVSGEFRFPPNIQLSFVAKDFIESALQVKPSLRPNIRELLKHPFLQLADKEETKEVKHPAHMDTAPTYAVQSYLIDKKGNLAYLMLDGTCGSNFTDGTRIILDINEDFMQIWASTDEVRPVIVPMTAADKKQVQISFILKAAKEMKSRCEIPKRDKLNPKKLLPNVKYWKKDGDCILFRMDNRVVQTNFAGGKVIFVDFTNKLYLHLQNLQDGSVYIPLEAAEKNPQEKELYSAIKDILNKLFK